MRTNLLILFAIVLCACEPEIKSIDNTSISVFEETNLYFDMAFKNDSTKTNDDFLRLDAGRVLVKKVKLPK